MVRNPGGHAQTLVAAHPGNRNAGRHGIYSPAMREARARAVTDELMQLPHVTEADRLAVEQVGREQALVDTLTERLTDIGLDGPPAAVSLLLDYLGRAEGRLAKALAALGSTPVSRAKWARDLAEGESLADSIRARRAAAEGKT